MQNPPPQPRWKQVLPWAAASVGVIVTYWVLRKTTVMDANGGWRQATLGDNAQAFVFAGVAGALALQIGLAVAAMGSWRREDASARSLIHGVFLIASSTVCWLVGGAVFATMASIAFAQAPAAGPPGPGTPTVLLAFVIGALAMLCGATGLNFLRRGSRGAARGARWSVVVTLLSIGLWPIVTLDAMLESARASHAVGAATGALLIGIISPIIFAIWLIGHLVLTISLAREENESPANATSAPDGTAP